jgi:hypothetical protein
MSGCSPGKSATDAETFETAHFSDSFPTDRRRDPAGDLRSSVDPELVKDAAHVAVHCALGDEEARADLLVAQAVGDKPPSVATNLTVSKSPSIAPLRARAWRIPTVVATSSASADTA